MAGEANQFQRGSVQYYEYTGGVVQWGDLSVVSRVRRGVFKIPWLEVLFDVQKVLVRCYVEVRNL